MKKEEFKLPKRLALLGDIFTINQKDKLTHPNWNAEILHDKKELNFNTKKIKELNVPLGEVFWHELGHYFARYYNLEYSEVMAQAFANFIYKINNQLKDDKKN